MRRRDSIRKPSPTPELALRILSTLCIALSALALVACNGHRKLELPREQIAEVRGMDESTKLGMERKLFFEAIDGEKLGSGSRSSLPRTIDLAYHDDEGKFQSKFGALADGTIWVDKVIHTAVMDTNTCDECAEVDGEEMELGDDRQLELHPPYVKCLGGDRCRCVQIALLSDGSEVEIDEVPDEAYDED